MKAILICPFAKTVTETEIDTGLAAIYAALSTDDIQVGTFQIINLDVVDRVRNTLYVDEDARLRRPALKCGFEFGNYHTTLLGRGLILGTSRGGESRSTTYGIQQIRIGVRFGEYGPNTILRQEA